MKAVSNRLNIVHYDLKYNFRSNRVALALNPGNCHKLFMLSVDNPYHNYKIRTTPLNSNTDYDFQVVSVDNLKNESVAVQGTVVVPEFQMFPRFINYTYLSSHAIRLTWQQPVDGEPDYYMIYTNNGSGEMDHDHVYQQVAGSITSVDLNLANNSTWLLKVEANKNGKESRTKFIVEVKTPAESVPPPSIFIQNTQLLQIDPDTGKTLNSSGNGENDETGEVVITGSENTTNQTVSSPASFSGVTSSNINAGKIKFSFVWIYGSLATKFRLYHDNGTGTIDYGFYYEFDRLNSIVQTFTTEQVYYGFDDKEYRFVVRPVNQFNVEDANTVEHRVLLDGIPPEEIENLSISVDI